MISKLNFMSNLVLLFLITLSLADNLKNIEEVDVVDIGSKDRLFGEFYNSVDARRNLALPQHAVIDFPFDHQCVSGKKKRREVRQQAHDSLNSSTDLGQEAIKAFMQMIVAFTPLKTMCLGNLRTSDFASLKNSDSSLKSLSCDLIDDMTRGTYLSNIGFAVKYGRRKPGFCSTISEYNNNLTFQMAFNKDMVNKVVQKIPKFGKLLSKVSTPQIAFGISKGGYISKTFTYWKSYDRTKTLGAHAMLKMNIVLDPAVMAKRFFEDYIARVGFLPTNFIYLVGDMEAYVRFLGNIDDSINCVYGGAYCTEDNLINYIFDNEIYLTGTGTVEIDLHKMVGVLPKISIDLRDAHVWRDTTGIYFKWKMSDIMSVLKDFLNETIGKMDGMPTLKTEKVEFDAYIDQNGFGFQGYYMTNELKCEVDFNAKDPVHCKYKNKFFTIVVEKLEDLADEAKAIYIETKEWAENTGEVIAKGAQAAVEVGAKVIDGAAKGVIEVADALGNEVDAILNNKKDWCDCGKKGKLRVWADGTPVYYLEARSNWQMIMWGKKVTTVSWKCTDGGANQRAKFDNGGSTWMVKFTHDKKTCRKGNDWFPGEHKSGRVYWK